MEYERANQPKGYDSESPTEYEMEWHSEYGMESPKDLVYGTVYGWVSQMDSVYDLV